MLMSSAMWQITFDDLNELSRFPVAVLANPVPPAPSALTAQWCSICRTSWASMIIQTNLPWAFCALFWNFFLNWCVPGAARLAALWIPCRARSDRFTEGKHSQQAAALCCWGEIWVIRWLPVAGRWKEWGKMWREGNVRWPVLAAAALQEGDI